MEALNTLAEGDYTGQLPPETYYRNYSESIQVRSYQELHSDCTRLLITMPGENNSLMYLCGNFHWRKLDERQAAGGNMPWTFSFPIPLADKVQASLVNPYSPHKPPDDALITALNKHIEFAESAFDRSMILHATEVNNTTDFTTRSTET